jgi:osmoprotectant transport system substrate-binding protein
MTRTSRPVRGTGGGVRRPSRGGATARLRRRATWVATVPVCLALVGCSAFDVHPAPRGRTGDGDTIVVGVSGAFPENQLVAEMYAQVLEHAGFTVERQLELRSREVSQNALESGRIDLKPEYLSSLLLFIDPNARASDVPVAAAAQVRTLLRPRGITLLTPSRAQDTNQFVANAETAERFNLTTMSSLAPVAGQLTLGAPPECVQRVTCLPGLKSVYGIVFDDFLPLDVGGPQTVAALSNDEVQIGLLFSTDPRIRQRGFVPLADDGHLQNAENITPVIRSDKVDDEVRSLLDAVSAKLSTETVTDLVGQVVIGGRDVSTVASDFLTANGLL